LPNRSRAPIIRPVIPQSFIQELLRRVDIVDVIEHHVPLKKAGANYVACCPFHHEKTPSFTVSPSKQFYHCFGCGVHGSAIGFLMEYSGSSYPDAIGDLANRAGMQMPEQETQCDAGALERRAELVEAMTTAARYFREQLKASSNAIAYLKRRGLTGEIAARFGLGYAPERWQNLASAFPEYDSPVLTECGLVIDSDTGRRYDRFRDRIMFPIVDGKGHTVGFGGRIIETQSAAFGTEAQGPKYLNSPETPLFEKGRELYGLPQARAAIRGSGRVIVVEGYTDVVALAQHGIESVVATLGTATTPIHVQKLLRQAERVIFCFDGDAAGRRAAWRALEASLEHLADNRTIAFLFLPPEHDPDSFVRTEGVGAFQARADAAEPLTAFLLRELRSRADLSTAEGRSRLLHEAKPMLGRVQAPLLRVQLVRMVAQAGQITTQELEAACGFKSPTVSAQRHAPPRTLLRRKPSLARILLKIAIQKPEWMGRVPLDVLDGVDQETQAVRSLVVAVERGELPAGSLNLVFEYFRNTTYEALLSELVEEIAAESFEEEAMENVLNDAVQRMRRAGIARAIDALTAKHREQGLSAEEQRQLAQLLSQKQTLSVHGNLDRV